MNRIFACWVLTYGLDLIVTDVHVTGDRLDDHDISDCLHGGAEMGLLWGALLRIESRVRNSAYYSRDGRSDQARRHASCYSLPASWYTLRELHRG